MLVHAFLIKYAEIALKEKTAIVLKMLSYIRWRSHSQDRGDFEVKKSREEFMYSARRIMITMRL